MISELIKKVGAQSDHARESYMQITIFVSICRSQTCTTRNCNAMVVARVDARLRLTSRCRGHVERWTGFGKYVSHFARDASFRNRHVPPQGVLTQQRGFDN